MRGLKRVLNQGPFALPRFGESRHALAQLSEQIALDGPCRFGFYVSFQRYSLRLLFHKQIHNEPNHQLLVARFALGDEQRQGYEGVVVDLWHAVDVFEVIVRAQEQDEQERADALVAVGEGMVFDDKIKQMRRFFLDAGIERIAAEGLFDGAKDANELFGALLAEKVRGLAFLYQPGLERVYVFPRPGVVNGDARRPAALSRPATPSAIPSRVRSITSRSSTS